MPRFPYMNLPFPFYKSYHRTPTNFYKYSHSPIQHSISPIQPNTYSLNNNNFLDDTNCSNDNDNSKCFGHKNKSNKNNDDFLFDLFGLKIYNDDVLLVSLIYFLYSEGVKDDGLFLVLILLLLS